MKLLSIKIGITNIVVLFVSILLFMSPLGRKPGAIHPILILPFFYCIFSFVTAIIGTIASLIELYELKIKKMAIIGFYLNVIYLVAYFTFVALSWNAWMGI